MNTQTMKTQTYADAGVSVDRGESLVRHIASLGSRAVAANLGGFAGSIPLGGPYRRPLLVTCTDGVGTKLLIARKLERYDTVGIDLVAMSVNDLAVCGAQPLQFLDYIACGTINERILRPVIDGIVHGCEMASCTLAGGETAEMPGLYGPEEFDLAGFAAGIVEADEQLPHLDKVAEGDVLLGIRSSGVHSNGFTLLRSVLPQDSDVWEELLAPTRIYVRELLAVREMVKAAAHITGGGIPGNTDRVLPDHLKARIAWDWPVPSVFHVIAESGVPREEMRGVFNMGIGVVLVAAPSRVSAIEAAVGETLVHVGEVIRG
jgi:phosphoribosylformylglycinamidine cyclo-ligase